MNSQRPGITSYLLRWEEAFDQGRDIPAVELCPDQPAVARELAQAIDALRRINGLIAEPDTVPPSHGTATSPPASNAIADTHSAPERTTSPRMGVPGYEILGELGRGGMGVVYKARQEGLNRIVALKMILSGGHAGVEDRLRFLAEAEAIAHIHHPGIVQIHDFGTHVELPYFSLEFCAGGSLAGKLGGKPLPPREAAEIVEQVSRAVHAAHQAGVVHRDLKPGNVLVGQAFQPDSAANVRLESLTYKVTDFGLAKRIESDSGMTRTGAIMGTPSYMAPEQAEGKKDIGPSADVYALGAILYECLVGRPPFLAATTFDTLLQVVSDEPVPPRRLQSGVPLDLETICLKALQKMPERRYASAAALADDLQRYQEGRPIEARPVGRIERLWRWCRREPIVAGLLAAVFLVLSAGVVASSVLASWALNEAATAENETIRANDKADEASRNEHLAIQREAEADRQRERAEFQVYRGKLALAQSEWKDNNGAHAIELLNECQWDLRGWEHRHLWTMYHSNQRTLRGHTKDVTCVAYSPDGKRIVSGSRDKTLTIWDAGKGEKVRTLEGHTEGIFSVAFSPDGKCIVSGSHDKTLKIWDAHKGHLIRTLEGHTDGISSVAYRPDGKRIVSGSGDKTLTIWDGANGQTVRTLDGHSDGVTSVAYSPDGKRILSGSADNTLKIWDPEQSQALLTLEGHTDGVTSVAYSPDGKRIVSGSYDNALKIWDADKGKEIFTLKGHHNRVTSVAYGPDGNRIVSGSWDSTLKIWDAVTGRELFPFKGHGHSVESVAWSPNGKHVVSGSYDKTLKIWDTEKRQEVVAFKGHTQCVQGVAFHPDGQQIVSASADNTLKIWDRHSGKEVFTLKGHTDQVLTVAFSRDGKHIVSGSEDNTVKVWDPRTGQAVLTLRGHTDSVKCVAFSPDGKRIVSGSADDTLKVWDAHNGKELFTLRGHNNSVTSVAYASDGKRIVSGSTDDTLKVWDAQRGKEVLTLEGHNSLVNGVAYSRDGKRIVSASDDGTLKIWDAANGQELFHLRGHSHHVQSVAFSPNGSQIVSGSYDRTLKIWDAQTGQEGLTLKGHTASVESVAFSPDGTSILSGSEDNTLMLWDSRKGQQVLTLEGHMRDITSVAYSPDGKRILSEDIKGKRLAWNSLTGQPADAGNDPIPRGQKEATHPSQNQKIRIDGTTILVHRRDYVPRPEPDRTTPDDMIRFHRAQAADSTTKNQSSAAAFHLERLYRLTPWDAEVRKRLDAALKEAPDSPAKQAIRRRHIEHDLIRRIGVIPAMSNPWAALPLVPLGTRRAE